MGSEALARESGVMEPVEDRLAESYLDLCRRCLTQGRYRAPAPPKGSAARLLYRGAARLLKPLGLELVLPVDPAAWEEGRTYTNEAVTMIGARRLESLQACVVDVLRKGVPGDLVETGVWRGGASIFMRAILHAYGVPDRTVWVADSFRGLPEPDAGRYPADAGDELYKRDALAVPLAEVKANFSAFGLLDDQVRFLPGWFRDTLPSAPVDRLAVLRLDGDLYESTMDALRALYPRLSPGGYVIVDDYGTLESCRNAVEDYRAEHGITETITRIDWTGVYWQRDA